MAIETQPAPATPSVAQEPTERKPLMTREQREAARARCERATPGPWCYDGDWNRVESLAGVVHPDCSPEPVVWVEDDNYLLIGEADADFIAAARTDLPAVLDTIDALAEMLRRLEWRPTYPAGMHLYCRVCGGWKDKGGHADGCELAALLAQTGGAS